MNEISAKTGMESQLSTQQISKLIENISGREQELGLDSVLLKKGAILIKEGDIGDGFFLLRSGRLGVSRRKPDGNEQVIGEIGPHSIVGELAMLSGQRRSTSIFALEDSELLSVEQQDFEKLVVESDSILEEISNIASIRWQNLHLVGALGELFGDLDISAWHELQENFEWLLLPSGETLFHQGDEPDGMYIVVNGRLKIEVTDGNSKIDLKREVGPTEIVGEYALITNEPRSATVVAVRETNLARLSPAKFELLLKTYPELMRKITLLIIKRQKENAQSSQGEPPARMTYTLLPTHPGIDLLSLADELAKELGHYGKTLVLNGDRFERLFTNSNGAKATLNASIQPLIIAKLDEIEAENRYLIFVADDEYTPWSQRVVGQADRLLIAARASDNPELSDIETVIKGSAHDTRTDLVLLHESDVKMPSGTSSWLKPRSIHNHYHIRSGDNAHLGRMARRISGHAIALVMGGGSAKGYAEMGFYKAMLETGIPFDYVGGTSMGAIMGGQMALESDYEAFEKNAQWTADIGVMDRTLPLVAMTASNNVKKINQHSCGETLIEDLWCPFFCVSTSLSTASLKVHQSGSMWRAIRASMSIPGVFVPVVEDGDVLVDGGIMNNFPVALMQTLAESNRIIGVDVMPYRERLRHYDIDISISGWRLLFNRLNPFSKRMKTPTLVEILMRTLEVNATKSSREQAALTDLLIQPDTRGFDPTAYDKWKPLAQRGYEASIEPLKAWKLKQGLK